MKGIRAETRPCYKGQEISDREAEIAKIFGRWLIEKFCAFKKESPEPIPTPELPMFSDAVSEATAKFKTPQDAVDAYNAETKDYMSYHIPAWERFLNWLWHLCAKPAPVVCEETLSARVKGKNPDATVKEALELRLVKEALNGNCKAARIIVEHPDFFKSLSDKFFTD